MPYLYPRGRTSYIYIGYIQLVQHQCRMIQNTPMANRKLKQQNIRKLSKIRKGSMGITLPAEYLIKLGWRERQLLKVIQKGRSLIIRDLKK